MVAQVVLALPLPRAASVFDYTVPNDRPMHVGQIVRAPFRRRLAWGVIWRLEPISTLPTYKLRPLAPTEGPPRLVSDAQRSFIDWFAQRSGVSPALIVKSFWRSGFRQWWPSQSAWVLRPKPQSETIVVDRQAQLASVVREIIARASGLVAIVVPDRQQLAQFPLPEDAVRWDSQARAAERTTASERLRSARVIVGTRSLFLQPLPQLAALILVDEGHPQLDQTDQQPRFAAYPVAERLATAHGCRLVVVSVAPSLTAYAATHHRGWQRRPAQMLAAVTVWPLQRGSRAPFPPDLKRWLQSALEQHERTFVFLNRRGLSQSVRCAACHWLARCARCNAALVLHTPDLRCHACGQRAPAPALCPRCGNPGLESTRPGTAALERALRTLYPGQVGRLDRDAPRLQGTPTIIVGTEYALPRLPALAPKRIVVLGLDSAFATPSARAFEHAFQHLRHLAALDSVDAIAIATTEPGHPLMRALADNNLSALYENEFAMRQSLGLPPAAPAIAFESRTAPADAAPLTAWLQTAGLGADALEGPVSTRRGRRAVVRYRLRGPAAARAHAFGLTGVPESWIIDPDPLD